MTIAEAREILGISNAADGVEIKKAYRKLAMQFHPDTNDAPDAKSNFIEVHEAYECLSKKRFSAATASSESYTNTDSKYKKPSDNFRQADWEIRYKAAQEHFDKAFTKKSEDLYQRFFDDYKVGWKRKFIKVMAMVGVLFAVIFTFDYFLGSEEKIADTHLYYNNNLHYSYVLLNGKEIRINDTIFAKYYTESFSLYYTESGVFNDFSKVNLVSVQHNFMEKITPINPFSTFPILPLILLFPLLGFLLEKPNFNYVFFVVHINIYIIPAVLVFILVDSWRIVKLFNFIF